MKNLKFVSISLIFIYLNACHEGSFIEKDNHLKISVSLSSSEYLSKHVPEEANNLPTIKSSTSINNDYYSFFGAAFISKIINAIKIKNPSNAEFILDLMLNHIGNKEDAFELFHKFNYKFRDYDDPRYKKINKEWHEFKGVIFGDKLNCLFRKFKMIIEKLKKGSAFDTCNHFIEKKITKYNGESLKFLIKNKEFKNLINNESFAFIDEILQLNLEIQEKKDFLSLKKNLESFKDFFEKYEEI